ncbi:dicarboxylate/amino acid:cation symporter [Thiospirochaeta perfilievii]|nr:cation:dicarboxylase symporter family transporter [Thiospirochaeta perfilievii]
MRMDGNITRVFYNPITILVSLVAGLFFGVNYPLFSSKLFVYGELFIKIITLFSLPLFITSVISSSASLARFPKFKSHIFKILLFIMLFTIISSVLGIITGVVGKPGLGISNSFFSSSRVTSFEPLSLKKQAESLISSNIFLSILKSNLFVISIFSLLLGASVGAINFKKSETVFNFIDGISSGLLIVINWISFFTPLGVFCLIASSFSDLQLDVIKLSSNYILIFYIIGLIISLLGLIIIWGQSHQKFINVFIYTTKSLLLSLATPSPLVKLPFVITVMSKKLKFDKESTNLFLPLGFTFGNFGSSFFYSLTTIFILQIYNIELSIGNLSFILLFSILAGFLSINFGYLLIISMLYSLLKPFGIPLSTVASSIISISVILFPIVSLITTVLNMVCSSIISKPNSVDFIERELGVLLQNTPVGVNLRSYFRGVEEEIALINHDKTDLLKSVFPNAQIKIYKNWEQIKDSWLNGDVNIIVGEKVDIEDISYNIDGDTKFVLLKPKV